MKHLILLFSAVLVIFGCSSNNNGTVTVVPLAPTNLTGAVISTTQINLSWTDNATSEDGYKIERKTGARNYAVVGSTSSNMTTFSDLGLTPSTSYTYRVYAYNSTGNSLQYSNELTISTQDSIPSWLTNGLVGYWPFNGNANDESGNGNNGMVNGATLASDRFGNFGKAYEFYSNSGQGGYIKVPNILLRDTFTISSKVSWYNNNVANATSLVSNHDGTLGYELNIIYSVVYEHYSDINNAHFSDSTIPFNEWHLITWSKTGSTSRLFLDNRLISSKSNINNISNSNIGLFFGRAGWGGNILKGKLDDIRIYNRALSASEIAYLAAH